MFYIITILVAVVDLVLFLKPYFEEDIDMMDDEGPPLPKNDFRRMINFFQTPGFGPPTDTHKSTDTTASAKCECNPHAAPSKNVKCVVGPNNAMRTHVIRHTPNLKFKCARKGTKGCTCCDCGSEEKSVIFTGLDIYEKGICTDCEQPTRSESGIAHFTKGSVYQMLFKMPLGLKYDYTALSMDITVEGNFTRSYDNDLMIGFMDGANTAWVAQRGDNGMWFSIGKYQQDGEEKRPLFHPFSLGYEKHGSRASKYRVNIFQNNAGNGETTIAVDNDLLEGQRKGTGAWSKRGWKSTGRGSDLHLVAFRDDDNEIYEIKKVEVKYEKITDIPEHNEQHMGDLGHVVPPGFDLR